MRHTRLRPLPSCSRALALALAFAGGVRAAPSLPPPDWSAPAGAPAAPGDAFAPTFTGVVDPRAPVIAEWSRTAWPDESFTLTGVRFTGLAGATAGADTTVWLWAATPEGGVLREARIWTASDWLITATVPADLPRGLYLLWVENRHGASAPVALNRAQANWLGPGGASAPAGATRRVFGRDLAYAHGTNTAHVFIRPATDGDFQACTVTEVNPYAVAFTVPAGLTTGAYEVFAHGGHGGAWGWSDPLPLRVEPTWQRGAAELAVAPSGADDWAALNSAVNTVTSWSNGGTVRLTAGTYTITRLLSVPRNVRLAGAGRTNTCVEVRLAQVYDSCLWAAGPNVALEDFTLRACASGFEPRYGIAGTPQGGAVSNLVVRRVGFCAESGSYGGRGVGFAFAGGEVAECVFDRTFGMNYATDVWVHDNLFHGGDHGAYGSNWSESGLSANTFLRLVAERNHFETLNWPTDPVTGSRRYRYDGFITSEQATYLPWCKRMMAFSCNMISPTHAYLAHNTSRDVGVEDNKGEMFLFHEGATPFYAQVATTDGLTVRITTNGLVHGQVLNIEGRPPATQVPDTLNPTGFSIDGNTLVLVAGGDGVGQYRRLRSHTRDTLTVDGAWRVPPTSNSVVMVLFIYQDCVQYRNELNAMPPGYVYKSHVASVGIDYDGNAMNCVAEGNLSRRTATARAIHGRATAPCMWNEFRDETALECLTGGDSAQVWTSTPAGSSWMDSVGPAQLGNLVRGGVRDCSNSVVSVGLNPDVPDSQQRLAVGGAWEHVVCTGRVEGVRAGNLADTLLRDLEINLPAGTPGVRFSRNAGVLLATNRYPGTALPYSTDITHRLSTWTGGTRNILKGAGNGDYARYAAVDFGGGANLLTLNTTTGLLRGTAHLDTPHGPVVAAFDVPGAGTTSFPVTGAVGVHDLYLVFDTSSFQLEWWRFTGATTVERKGGLANAFGNTLHDSLLARASPVPLLRTLRFHGRERATGMLPLANTGCATLVPVVLGTTNWATCVPASWALAAEGLAPDGLQVTVDPATLTPGEHTATFLVTGAPVSGVPTVTNAVRVRVTIDSLPFELAGAILGGTLVAGDCIALDAYGTLLASGWTVTFYSSVGGPIGTAGSAPYSVVWSDIPYAGAAGADVWAVASDGPGGSVTSAVVHVWIQPPPAPLHFVERFESDTCPLGALDGHHGWTVSSGGVAHVQSTTVHAGNGTLELAPGPTGSPSRATHYFTAPTARRVRVSAWMQALPGDRPAHPETGSATWVFDDDLRLNVYDGTRPAGDRWLTLTATPALDYASWVQVEALLDYDRQRWELRLNGVRLAEELGFGGLREAVTALQLEGEGCVDDIDVAAVCPPADTTGTVLIVR